MLTGFILTLIGYATSKHSDSDPPFISGLIGTYIVLFFAIIGIIELDNLSRQPKRTGYENTDTIELRAYVNGYRYYISPTPNVNRKNDGHGCYVSISTSKIEKMREELRRRGELK